MDICSNLLLPCYVKVLMNFFVESLAGDDYQVVETNWDALYGLSHNKVKFLCLNKYSCKVRIPSIKFAEVLFFFLINTCLILMTKCFISH